MHSQKTSFRNGYVLDLGMHMGDDTAYYLHRGFNVVAVEANPELTRLVQEKFHDQIQAGSLAILNYALTAPHSGDLEFHICDANLEWSSLERWRVESTGHLARIVRVPGILLEEIIKEYGKPHYIKCDIEGADGEFIAQLGRLAREELPAFVSIEGIEIEWLRDLARMGYDRAQLVNQARIRRGLEPPLAFSLGGEQRSWTFSGHSSGPFGTDLDVGRWISIDEAVARWLKFLELQLADPQMTLDIWFDFHVTTSQALGTLMR
jgi:FkbM family methyltransferase